LKLDRDRVHRTAIRQLVRAGAGFATDHPVVHDPPPTEHDVVRGVGRAVVPAQVGTQRQAGGQVVVGFDVACGHLRVQTHRQVRADHERAIPEQVVELGADFGVHHDGVERDRLGADAAMQHGCVVHAPPVDGHGCEQNVRACRRIGWSVYF
jgi:hypothetical protein